MNKEYIAEMGMKPLQKRMMATMTGVTAPVNPAQGTIISLAIIGAFIVTAAFLLLGINRLHQNNCISQHREWVHHSGIYTGKVFVPAHTSFDWVCDKYQEGVNQK